MKRSLVLGPRTLGAKLLALVAASAVVPILAATATLTWFERQAVEQAAIDLLHARADQLAGDVDAFHDYFGSSTVRWAAASAAVEVLATLPAPSTATLAQLQFSMDKVRGGDPRIMAIAVVDAAGRLIQASADAPPARSAPLPGFENLRTVLERTRKDHHAVVPSIHEGQPGQLLYGRAVGKPTKGYVVFAVRMEPFWQAVRQADDKAGRDSFALVLDEHGVRVAHSRSPELVFRPADPKSLATRDALMRSHWYGPQTERWLNEPVPAPEMARHAADPSDTRVFRDWTHTLGAHAIIVQRPLRHVPWSLFYCLPENAIAERLWAPIGRGVAVALALASLALALGWVLARRIVVPLDRLRTAVAQLRNGDLTGRVDLTSSTEFKDLLDDFNAMAEALRQSHASLETKVAERTAELQDTLKRLKATHRELADHAHELAAQTEELQAQQEELNLHSRQLQEANSHKSRFLTNMSHELRTPLNAILGFSELLLQEHTVATPDERRQFIVDIHGSGQHLLHLINDLLDLARIEAGHLRLDLDTVYPRTALDEASDLVRGLAKSRSVTLELAAVSQLPVVADRLRLRQVLVNLLGNGVKFSPAGATVQLGADAAKDDQLCFWVKDHGPGLDDELKARLFEPFVLGDESLARRHAGTGLGLAISRTLVEAMGGRIGVDSAPNVGSRFWFTLPRASGAALPERRVTHSGHFAQTLRGVPVLVCCSDERDAASLADPLTAVGAVVRQVSNMVGALESALANPPVVCVCDESLMDGDATALFAALASDPDTAGIAQVVVQAPGAANLATTATSQPIRAIKGTFSGDEWVATVERAAGLCLRPVAAPELTAAGPCVLVVDDNDVNRDLVAHIVRGIGARVVLASDGFSALDQARQHRPVLALLDLAMPGMDGFATLAALRAEPDLRGVPCVAVTAMAMPADEARVRAAGFVDYVTKPIDVGRMVGLLRRLILTGKG